MKVSFWSSDETSGVEITELWFRFSVDQANWDPDWTDSGQSKSGATGYFYFNMSTYGTGFYEFYTISSDIAGNVESPPSKADCKTTFDDQVPISSAESESYVNTESISVSYSASGGASGLNFVELWYRYSSDKGQSWTPDWTDTGERRSAEEGSFAHSLTSGDGWYEFHTIAVGNTGVREDPPEEADTRTALDRVAPESSCESDEYSSVTSTDVSYSSSDSLSGISLVNLYYSYEGGGYSLYNGDQGTDPSGSIEFEFKNGDGLYSFYTIAEDLCGNVEDAPGGADTTTFLDTTDPLSSASCPESSSDATISVSFTASDGAGVGVDGAWLYYKFGGSEWQETSDWADGSSGAFTFVADKDETYSFCTVARDIVGNIEDLPAEADCVVLIDTTSPSSTCTAPDYVTRATVAISFNSSDSGSGIAGTTVWYRMYGEAWTASNRWEGGESGEIMLEIASEGTVQFCTIARDRLGNYEEPPSTRDAESIADRSAPQSSCESPTQTSSSPIEVAFTAVDALTGISSVELWYRGSGDWGLYEITGASEGAFSFAPSENGLFQFYTLAADSAGNKETPPAEPDCATLYDTLAPSSSASSPEMTNSIPFGVDFTASDEGVGQIVVRLWYCVGEGEWIDSDLDSDETSGTFTFTPDDEGVYNFYTIASDGVGNEETPPASPDCTTIVDLTAPRSTCSSPQYANEGPITVEYASIDDGDAGLLETELWYRFNDGEFISTGIADSGEAGEIEFAPDEGPGVYDFYTIGTDKAGNIEAPPDGYDASAIFDPLEPSTSCVGPEVTNSTTIEVTFTATDDGPSGMKETGLWFSYEAAEFIYSGLSKSGASGVFAFETPSGEGRYDFYTVGLDKAGNSETHPDEADCSTLVDLSPPASVASCPPWGNEFPVRVEFYEIDSEASGVEQVELFASIDGSEFLSTGLTSEDPFPSFYYTGVEEQSGTYRFFTLAIDAAGNVEAVPDVPDCTFVYDIVAPASSCDSVSVTNGTPIELQYSASDGIAGSSLSTIGLFYAFDGGGWENSSLEATSSTGAFEFSPAEGEGSYGFCTIAQDRAGNREEFAEGADSVTLFDITPPTSACSAPTYTNAAPVAVEFDATDGLSGVKDCVLWFKLDDGSWLDSEFREQGDSGSFDFTPSAEGVYALYTVATDMATNAQDEPTETSTACSEMVYDVTPPTSSSTAPEATNETPIVVSFDASDNLSPIAQGKLWYRYEGGSWRSYDGLIESPSGQWEFEPTYGQGQFEFYVQVFDAASNRSSTPNASTKPLSKSVYDSEAPTVVSCSCDPYANKLPIAVQYELVDATTNIARVALWYRYNGGAWTSASVEETEASGSLEFGSYDHEGRFEFFLVMEDVAGNSSAAPSAETSSLCETTYDRTRPTSTASAPEFTSTVKVRVDFTASDGLSGVKSTRLWFAPEGKTWSDTGLSKKGSSGTFEFLPSNPNERYLFYTLTTDNAGNFEAEPTTSSDAKAQTLCDRIEPESAASCPEYTDNRRVSVEFSATDVGSGVAQTELWYRAEGEGWLDTGLSSTENSGSFVMWLPEGEGTYNFYTQSTDRTGNKEATPSSSTKGKCTTVYDKTSPTSECNAPEYPKNTRIVVSFDAHDEFAGIASTRLWYRFKAGDWIDTKLVVSGASGDFEFVMDDGQGNYGFYTRAVDRAGNSQPQPNASTEPHCESLYDLDAPSSTSTCPEQFDDLPILVSFSASDSLSGVATTKLFYQYEAGVGQWLDSGLEEPGKSGTFEFNPTEGIGEYCFYTVSTDISGNAESVGSQVDPTECCTEYGATQPPELAVSLHSDYSMYCVTSHLQLSMDYANTGGAVEADLYLSVRLPQSAGGARIYWNGSGLTDARTPLRTMVDLYSGIEQTADIVFRFGPMGQLPEGEYTWSAWFCRTGTDEVLGSVANAVYEFESNCLNLALSTNQSQYVAGDDLTLYCDLENAGAQGMIDFYCAVALPDGTLLFLPSFSMVMGPMLSGLTLPIGLDISGFPVFEFPNLPLLSSGDYRWYAAFLSSEYGSFLSDIAYTDFAIAE
ncbi:MAG: hypothetical protein JW941_00450 [Candidatus Coatesbacteria bacterium]|nr:hypothetical protein [Candidatus Coatesbacteria bacterium]